MINVRRQLGLTLIEVMVAIAIALLVLLAMVQAFITTNATRLELDKAGRQAENGRYALELLRTDLKLAGYYGEFSGTGFNVNAPADVCTVSNLASLGWTATSYPVHVTGLDDSSPSCVDARMNNTDVIVVRRASTASTTVADAGAPANSSNYYLQTSGCSDETTAPVIALGSAGSGTFNLHRKDCSTVSGLQQYVLRIYYISNAAVPTLRRQEFLNGAWQEPVDMVDGIENMQLEYAVDTDGDGAPDQQGLNASAITASCAAAPPICWENVVSATIYLLARNTETTTGFEDDKSYQLGSTNLGVLGGAFKRHVYSVTVPFVNPAGRRE